MITKLTLKNFRCFRDFTLDGIRPVTLIAGGNNVGKSTILESIFLFLDRHTSDVFLKLNSFRGIPVVKLSSMMIWEPLFTDMNISESIEITMKTNNDMYQTVTIAKDKLFSSSSISDVPFMGQCNISGTFKGSNLSTPNNHPLLPNGHGSFVPNSYPLILRYSDTTGYNIDSVFTLTETGINLFLQKPVTTHLTYAHYFSYRTIGALPHVVELFGQIELTREKTHFIKILQKLNPQIKDLSVVVIGGISGIYADIVRPAIPARQKLAYA